MNSESHHIHIIDDSPDLRESLSILLDASGYRCATYSSALDFLKRLRPGITGCVVADVRMPGMTGIELLKELKLGGVALPVIVITAHADVPMAVAALKAGAVDFIEKPFRDELLLSSIESAMKPQAPDAGSAGGNIRLNLDVLSPREQEVLLLLVAGHQNKAIADRLGISTRTVEVHRAHIMEKTGAGSFAELVRLSCAADPPGG